MREFFITLGIAGGIIGLVLFFVFAMGPFTYYLDRWDAFWMAGSRLCLR